VRDERRPASSPVEIDPAAAGDAFAELVVVMDLLRSPGGCPWDAEQTHASLAPYAIEEAYEVAEAAERGDAVHLCEELGDLLLQVVFHARVAAEDPDSPFGVLEVVRGLVAKLERRHPHVFGDVEVSDADQVVANWSRIKQAEKPRRDVLDGVPRALPALARAQKAVSRARAAGLPAPAPSTAADDVGPGLLALVALADASGVDAEAALRSALGAYVAGLPQTAMVVTDDGDAPER
jgi:XTP/dITP diphosphohydrolase